MLSRYIELSTDVRNLCEGFGSGVNHYMRERPETIPAWAEPVMPESVVVLAKRYVLFCDLTIPLPLLTRFKAGRLEGDPFYRASRQMAAINGTERLSQNDECHCEERSDEAISILRMGDCFAPPAMTCPCVALRSSLRIGEPTSSRGRPHCLPEHRSAL